MRSTALGLGLLLAVLCGGCSSSEPRDSTGVAVPDRPGATKTAALERAERRLFDGAPPTIPHEPLGAACISCHNEEGLAVEGLGFSPPSPHLATAGMSAISRCEQCHVFSSGNPGPWRESSFSGLRQDLRKGQRLHALAPPVVPHAVFMRENCQACHSGPAAREEIRTTHPERVRCQQCHVEQVTVASLSLD